ncbi:MAG: molybdopterin cofactor-binding domain-containing protein [Candidatus Sericytochromatia bacterium]
MATQVSRRDFLKGLAAGGLLLALGAWGCRNEQQAGTAGSPPELTGKSPTDPHTWLAISPDGTVHIVVARSEMGPGVRTTLALAIADELEADRDRVRLVQAVGDETRYGSQNTDGSTSVRDGLDTLRRAGAKARHMLRAAAADAWGVPIADVEARHHELIHAPSGRKAGYGEFAAAAGRQAVPDTIALKDIDELKYLGTDTMSGYDQADMVTGRAVFGADVRLPGMKFAAIARPPVYGGTVQSYDDQAATAVPGVEQIVRLPDVKLPAGFSPLGGMAVIASNTWAAIQGRNALTITWNNGPNHTYDSKAYRQLLEGRVSRPTDKVVANRGDVAAALSRARRVVKAGYYTPHLAHAPMEPPAAIANVADGKCEVWACTQNPQGARDELAKALGLPAENVTVHVTLLGGGFGRKSKPDFMLEAALLSRAVKAPVRVQWTREDEIRHGYYHTVSAQHLEASLDAGNRVTGWLHRSAFPSIGSLSVPGVIQGLDFEFGMGFKDQPFDIPNARLENAVAEPHVRIGWFRSVANVYHAFATSSFIDELAAVAGQDPKDFLLALIGKERQVPVPGWNYGREAGEHPLDTARLRHVIEVAAEKAGWGRQLPKGHALGIAAHRSFLTYVATVVEVAVAPDGTVTVPTVHTAVDCGFAVNPDRVRAQMEGAAVMGMSLAMHGAVTFKEGRAEQSNYHDFRVMRMNTAPREVHTHIVNTGEALGGVGEPGLPVFAPALCNALYAATGKRIRELPIAGQLRTV